MSYDEDGVKAVHPVVDPKSARKKKKPKLVAKDVVVEKNERAILTFSVMEEQDEFLEPIPEPVEKIPFPVSEKYHGLDG